jgi:hypothetical protein
LSIKTCNKNTHLFFKKKKCLGIYLLNCFFADVSSIIVHHKSGHANTMLPEATPTTGNTSGKLAAQHEPPTAPHAAPNAVWLLTTTTLTEKVLLFAYAEKNPF